MPDDFVTVGACFSVEEAHVLKNLLEAEGITVYLADEKTAGFAWHLSNAIGGVKLQVRADQADRAMTILERPADRITAADVDALAVAANQSDCGEEMQDLSNAKTSTRTRKNKMKLMLSFGATLLCNERGTRRSSESSSVLLYCTCILCSSWRNSHSPMRK